MMNAKRYMITNRTTARHFATYRALLILQEVEFDKITKGLDGDERGVRLVIQEFSELLAMLSELAGDSPEEMIGTYTEPPGDGSRGQ